MGRARIQKSHLINPDLHRMKGVLDVKFGFDILNRTRTRGHIDARRIFVRLISNKYGVGKIGEELMGVKHLTTIQLAEFMGFDHSTLTHLKRTFSYVENDPELFKLYKSLIPALYENGDIFLKALREEKKELVDKLFIINAKIENYEKNTKSSNIPT